MTIIISEFEDVIDNLLKDLGAIFHVKISGTYSIDIKIPKIIWRFMATK